MADFTLTSHTLTDRLAARLGVSRQRLRDNIDGWLFVLPAVLGILAFRFYPVVMSLFSSFTRWDGMNPREWVGLGNYVQMFTQDSFFRLVLKNTLYYVVTKIPFTVLIALFLALLTNRDRPFTIFFRTAYYTPVVTSTIAIAIVWQWILAGQYGVLNYFLAKIGIQGPDWLANVSWAMMGVVIVSVWHGVGYPMVIYLAALQGIPEVLYEAAEIDGATAMQKLFKITIPLISPSTFYIVILQFISSFQIFGLIYVMTGGGPANSTNVYINYLYQNAFAWWKMGYASALAWVLFIIIGVTTMVQWKLQRRWVFYS
jgi:multiple sugar transport system permease protein